jgi:anti-sigma regulatory factor (Ser/Thr protein kinase)
MPERVERMRELVARAGDVSNRDVARTLRVSAATSHRLLRALVEGGILERHGRGPAARYRLRSVRHRFRLSGLQEDRAWDEVAADIGRIRPLGPLESQSLRYAATEMLNNAIEHSRGRAVKVAVSFEPARTTVTTIEDDGVGVFSRLREDFGFRSPHDAVVQLEKGKLTSDPTQHSGEGIFFSSKAVSLFRLESQGVAWIVDNLTPDTAIGPSDVRRGTRVTLTVVEGRMRSLQDVFAAYTDPESLGFVRTRTTVKLSALGTGLISRSEARRLLQRLTEFTHVILDFSGVEVVGQGFCDEVFRVFARLHPEIALEPVGMNEAVSFMVARARTT